MKVLFILKALLMVYLGTAQTKSQATVHIRKVENVNGHETSWDTTFTATDTATIRMWRAGAESGHAEGGRFSYVFKDSVPGRVEMRRISTEKELSAEQLRKLGNGFSDPSRGNCVNHSNNEVEVIVREEKVKGGLTLTTVNVRRIRLVDADGSEGSTLSATPAGSALAIDKLVCYPNPASSQFQLDFVLPGADQVQVEILGHDGTQVFSQTLKGVQGAFTQEFDLSDYKSGVYLVRISHGTQSAVKKLVIEQ